MTFLTNLTLGKKIAFLTTIGLLLGVGVFSTLSMRAVNQATETMLQDRITTAHVVADYVDETLERALIELESTAMLMESDMAENKLEPQIEAFEAAYSRLSIYINDIYLLDGEGQIIWRKRETRGLEGDNISAYPSISQAIGKGETTISGLVPAPVTEAPVVLLTSPIEKGQQESRGTLVVAIDLTQSSIAGFVQPIRLGETGYSRLWTRMA